MHPDNPHTGRSAHSDVGNHAITGGLDHRRSPASVLAPLVSRLERYDALRTKLQETGGEVDDLRQLTAVLQDQFTVEDDYGAYPASLADGKALRRLVSYVGLGRVFLDIRRQRHGLPVYYLSRVEQDYWSEYSLIVEDLYLSPEYRFTDDRFARLMYIGHETYHLRASRFRSAVVEHLACCREDPGASTDDFLKDIGRHCLSSMWHDEQRPAVVTANQFGLVRFQQAVELLYLCLSADLCELRSRISPAMAQFFSVVYPQPGVLALLDMLWEIDGNELNVLPRKAVQLFAKLSRAFREFLSTEIAYEHGPDKTATESPVSEREMHGMDTSGPSPIPLFKLIFGNFYQLDPIAEETVRDPDLRRAVEKIEQESSAIIRQMIGKGIEEIDGDSLGRNRASEN